MSPKLSTPTRIRAIKLIESFTAWQYFLFIIRAWGGGCLKNVVGGRGGLKNVVGGRGGWPQKMLLGGGVR